MDKKYVYIMKSNEYYKIGVSSNPQKRLKELQTGNPVEIEIVNSWKVRFAMELEKKLHDLFDRERVRLEWFKLDNEDLENIKKYIEANIVQEEINYRYSLDGRLLYGFNKSLDERFQKLIEENNRKMGLQLPMANNNGETKK